MLSSTRSRAMSSSCTASSALTSPPTALCVAPAMPGTATSATMISARANSALLTSVSCLQCLEGLVQQLAGAVDHRFDVRLRRTFLDLTPQLRAEQRLELFVDLGCELDDVCLDYLVVLEIGLCRQLRGFLCISIRVGLFDLGKQLLDLGDDLSRVRFLERLGADRLLELVVDQLRGRLDVEHGSQPR